MREQSRPEDSAAQVAPSTDGARGENDPWADVDAAASAIARGPRELHYRKTLLSDGARVHAVLTDVTQANIGAATKWLALFKIHDVESIRPSDRNNIGRLILRSWNPPRGRFLSYQHALAIDWKAIVGFPLDAVPKGYGPRGVLGAFLLNVIVLAETRVVARVMDAKERKWKPTPPSEHYSVITKLMSRVGGTPPRILQRVEERRKK